MCLRSEDSIQFPPRRARQRGSPTVVLSKTSVIASGCEDWLSHLPIPHIAEKRTGRKACVKAASGAQRSGRRALTRVVSRPHCLSGELSRSRLAFDLSHIGLTLVPISLEEARRNQTQVGNDSV